jgi:hypothetical protein
MHGDVSFLTVDSSDAHSLVDLTYGSRARGVRSNGLNRRDLLILDADPPAMMQS